MSKILLLFFAIHCLLKIGHAKPTDRVWPTPPTPPIANQPRPAPMPTANQPRPAPTPILEGPKCYPETATVYFLPAPPSSPKITVLDPNTYKESKVKANIPDVISTVKEIPIKEEEKPQKSSDLEMTGRVFPPPPPCSTGLPDLLDDIPSLLKDRFSRLAEHKPCESCGSLLKKLPIFNFDQELLDGFLAGIKL